MPHTTNGSAVPSILRSTLEVILVALSEGVLTIGPGGRIEYANRRAEEMFGYVTSDFLGAPVDALVREVLGNRPSDSLAKRFVRFHVGGANPASEIGGSQVSGNEVPGPGALATPVSAPPGLVPARGESLTRLESSHGALPACGGIEALDLPIVLLDRGGIITATNHTWEQVLRTRDRGAVGSVGTNYLEVYNWSGAPHSVAVTAIEHGVRDVLRGASDRFVTECPFRVEGGEVRWYQVRVVSVSGHNRGASVTHWDVTDQRRAERALRESEQRFRAVVESQVEPISRFRLDGTLVFVNSAYCRYFGRSAEELIGQTFWKFIPEQDWEPVRCHLASITSSTPTVTIENRVLAPNGEVRWTQWTNRGFFGPSNELIEFQSTGRDITDQKRSEERLRQSEERFRDLFHNAPLATACWRADGGDFVLADCNEAAKRLTGGGITDVLGRKVSEVHADNAAHRANIECCYRERKPFEAELVWHEVTWGGPRLSGADLLVSYSFVPPNLVMSSIQIITERKQQERALRESEERHRLVLSGLREGVVSLDPDGRILTCNESALRLFGGRHDGLVGLLLTDRVGSVLQEDGHPLSADLIPWELVRRGGAPSAEVTLLAAPGGGPVLRLLVSAHAIPAAPGCDHTVVVSFTDVTARWLTEEQLRLHKAELAHVTRCSIVGEMAAVLAHELNQPLTAVINYCRGSVRRLGDGTRDPAEVVEGLNLAVGQAERAAGIIHRLREFIQKREPHRSTVPINDIVEETLVLVGPELRHHGVQVVLRLAPEPPLIQVDRIQIEQVLLNLIRNSAEALTTLPAAERRIVIETAATAAGVCVRVIDSGIGFDADGLRRVFEPFYTTKKEGMGLGLTISRSIIESHGGLLTIAPARPRGAEFRFTLPTNSDPPPLGGTEGTS